MGAEPNGIQVGIAVGKGFGTRGCLNLEGLDGFLGGIIHLWQKSQN